MGIFDEIAERRIKEAIENDEFKDLSGMGEPVDNTDYFSVPEQYRLSFHILKNAKILPEEIEIKKKIQNINSLIREQLSQDERDSLITERSELLTKLDIFLEMHKNNKY